MKRIAQNLMDGLEDHFAQTGEAWQCFWVIVIKAKVGLNIHREGWK